MDYDVILLGARDEVEKIARRMLRPWEINELDDLVGDCLEHLWRWTLPRYDPTRGQMKYFLRRAIQFRLIRTIKLMRRRRSHQHNQDIGVEYDLLRTPSREPQPSDQAAANELLDVVRHRLTPHRRRILQHLADRAPGETQRSLAKRLGVTPQAIACSAVKIRREMLKIISGI